MLKFGRLIFLLVALATIFVFAIFFYANVHEITFGLKPAAVPVNADTSKISQTHIQRRLEIDNIYWSTRIQMAQDKSIDLLLDLVTKEISLEIKGVLVYTAEISNYIFSSHLQNTVSGANFKSWIGRLRTLKYEWASIAKEPIQVRDIRPRSEGENILTHFRDPESDYESYVILRFTDDFVLIMRQIESVPDSLRASGIPPLPYPDKLEVFVSRLTVNTIYRALNPGNSTLAIRPE